MVPQPEAGRRAERIVDDGVPIDWKVRVDRLERGGEGHEGKISRWWAMRYDSYGRTGVAGAVNYSRMSARGRKTVPGAGGSVSAGAYTSGSPADRAAREVRADRVTYSDSRARRGTRREAPVGGELAPVH
jgi:hypothetical protein